MAPGEGGYRQINKALNICAFEEYLGSQQKTLPTLPDVEQISPRVIHVLGQNPGKFTLQGTNTFIVGTGSERLLVDTDQGVPDGADLINDTLVRHGISLSHVLLTHWHGDHTGGVPDLIRMYPHLASAIYKHTPSKTQQPIVDGQLFVVEGATVRALHTPGCFRSIALYLVDPHYRVCSTRNVPPQQHHWWAQAISHDLAAAGLPQEIIDEIMQGTDSWPMGLPEARRHRREFLKEHRWNNLIRIGCMRRPYFHCS